ncbi:hypothetical protein PhCBS80983_g04189 [Powellomyces hirtus]|uniref:F-box domain-containing protein n=1 Tax=Powellomyces hirtus TaxID=109895 RepID=A0A507E0L5_9FUNG|nr:hypothetical protein PhCBS80983_g04189 [Powellomyces hirtus]
MFTIPRISPQETIGRIWLRWFAEDVPSTVEMLPNSDYGKASDSCPASEKKQKKTKKRPRIPLATVTNASSSQLKPENGHEDIDRDMPLLPFLQSVRGTGRFFKLTEQDLIAGDEIKPVPPRNNRDDASRNSRIDQTKNVQTATADKSVKRAHAKKAGCLKSSAPPNLAAHFEQSPSPRRRRSLPLPDSILRNVFSFVNHPRSFSLVCRQFHRVSKSPHSRAAFFIQHSYGGRAVTIPSALLGPHHRACYLAVLDLLLRDCPLPRWLVQLASIDRDMRRLENHKTRRERRRARGTDLAPIHQRKLHPQQQQQKSSGRIGLHDPRWTHAWTNGTLGKLISHGQELYGDPAQYERDWQTLLSILSELRQNPHINRNLAASHIRHIVHAYGYRPWDVVCTRRPSLADILSTPAARAQLSERDSARALTRGRTVSSHMSITSTTTSTSFDSSSTCPADSSSSSSSTDSVILTNYNPKHDLALRLLPISKINVLCAEDVIAIAHLDPCLIADLATPRTRDAIIAILATHPDRDYICV